MLEFGLNPLCVTASTDILTDIGRRNIENIKKESFKENSNPEEELINKERYNHLNEKIDELKPMYREILKLKYIEDLSINQISKKIDQPINTVKIKIYRAKRILSDILELK